jgi:hypothetical protein
LEAGVVLGVMPQVPLPEALTAVLQLDRTAALAAAFVIGTHHADVLQWVASMIGDGPTAPPPPKANGAARRGRKGNGHRKPRRNGDDPYLSRRRAQREADDQALVEAMKVNAAGPIAAWAERIEKSRTSCISGLHRLRAAGVAENSDGVWSLVEASAPREPASKWVAPLSAAAREQRAHAVA